jgi:hypothetical protein
MHAVGAMIIIGVLSVNCAFQVFMTTVIYSSIGIYGKDDGAIFVIIIPQCGAL